jgi:NADH-quinone oxidoreductase subunit G
MGLDISLGAPREIMEEIASSNPAFNAVNYERMDNEMGINLNASNKEGATA